MKQYIVDAFTKEIFKGNPAAICILDEWLTEDLMMNITMENNLSETAFAVKVRNGYHLRWFTLGGEIDLCGHATLATAFVIANYYEKNSKTINFQTMSGEIVVKNENNCFEISFPSFKLEKLEVTQKIVEAIGCHPLEVYKGRDLLCILDSKESVRNVIPDQEKIRQLDGLLFHITAKSNGNKFDCVSRTFAPKCNMPEDPVCGSGHCHIIPFWAKKLKKNELVAYQASKRGGVLYGKYEGDRTKLSGYGSLYSTAEIYI